MWTSPVTLQGEFRKADLYTSPDIHCRIVSYINNLHPQDHAGLYRIIEKVIGKVIPLWNATLSPLRSQDWSRRVEYSDVDYGDLEEYTEREGPKQEEGEDRYAFWDRKEEWQNDKKKDFLVLPNPEPFVQPPSDEKGAVDLKADFGATGLQIIVKLANIHLTPDKPTYEGGTWHVEGQLVRMTAVFCALGLSHSIPERAYMRNCDLLL